MARIGQDAGTCQPGPARTRWSYKQDNTQTGSGVISKREFEDEELGWNPRLRCDEFWDFNGKLQLTTGVSDGLATVITKTAGSPTVSQLANTANGVVEGAHDATNELQFVGLSFGDQKGIVATHRPLFKASVRIPTAIGANEDIVIGLATNYNSTLASTTKYAWFRLSASMVATLEGKDGTNTFTSGVTQPATYTLVANQWYMFTVDFSKGAGNVRFFIDDDLVNGSGSGTGLQLGGGMNLSAFATTDVLQPLIGLRKASGTTVHTLDIDWLRTGWNRYGP